MGKEKIKKLVDVIFAVAVSLIVVVSVPGIAFEISNLGKIYPGIYVGGVNVGGMTPKQAQQAIAAASRKSDSLVLKWGVNEWTVPISSLGVGYNVETSVNKAVRLGRSEDVFSDIKVKILSIWQGVQIDPEIGIDKQVFDTEIQTISDQIDIPAKEPEIAVVENKIQVSAGENGQNVDKEKLINKISEQLRLFGSGKIDIPVIEIRPKLSEDQIRTAQEKANGIIGKKIILKDEEEGQVWELGQDQLLSWLDLKSASWLKGKMGDWVQELAGTIDRQPQNATFRFVEGGKVEEFKPAKDGRYVVVDQTVSKMAEGLNELAAGTGKDLTINLVMDKKAPEIGNDQVNNLGIKELIGRGESWFSGSITNRIFNLKKSAEAISGILVAPDEIFSFNKAVGEVSVNTGYKQAYIIKEGKTILGDGGGVCQVSSTLFRAILAAGLPIEERTAHAYRVHYYEEKYQPGFDATVFQPNPDFKFKNDTGAYILIQTAYDEKAKHLAFEIYGTDDGRKVEISKARIWDVTAPPPDLYQDDPNSPIGKVVQTEHAAWGAKVAFDWKVTKGDEILQQRTFYSNYRPWQAVFLRGTKPL